MRKTRPDEEPRPEAPSGAGRQVQEGWLVKVWPRRPLPGSLAEACSLQHPEVLGVVQAPPAESGATLTSDLQHQPADVGPCSWLRPGRCWTGSQRLEKLHSAGAMTMNTVPTQPESPLLSPPPASAGSESARRDPPLRCLEAGTQPSPGSGGGRPAFHTLRGQGRAWALGEPGGRAWPELGLSVAVSKVCAPRCPVPSAPWGRLAWSLYSQPRSAIATAVTGVTAAL